MTDLTDKLKKGELPSGEYWCLSICGDVDKLYCYQNSFWKYKTEDDYYGIPVEIKQVLAPVPSYDEWEKLNWYAGNGVEENQELKMENAKLRALLKECRLNITEQIVGTPTYQYWKGIFSDRLLTKIDEELDK